TDDRLPGWRGRCGPTLHSGLRASALQQALRGSVAVNQRSSGLTGDPAARAMGRRRWRIRTPMPTARIYPRFGGSMAYEDPVFGDVIYSYTRKQAIEDGVLVDITEMAKEAGIKYPVAITSTAFF